MGPGDKNKGNGLQKAGKAANRLDFDQISEWNQFAKGKPQVSLEALYKHYKQSNPNTSISFNALKNELSMASQRAKEQAAAKNTMNAEEATVGNVFPDFVVDGKNYGPANGEMQTREPVPARPVNTPRTKTLGQIPYYVKDLQWDSERNLPFYVDEKTGDTQYVEQSALNAGRFKKSRAQQQLSVANRGTGDTAAL